MKRTTYILFLLTFFVLTSGCGSFRHKGKDSDLLDFKTETQHFFLNPSAAGLARMAGVLRVKPVWEDDFLVVFVQERALDPDMMKLAAESFQKNPTLTYQALFFLAFEVPQGGGHVMAKAAYQKYRHDNPELAASTADQRDNLPKMLAGDSSTQQTNTMLTALDTAWAQLSPGERGRIIRGLSDTHLDDSAFVAKGFKNHDAFLRAKKKQFISAMKPNPARQEMYALLKGTRLFNLEPPVLPELERFIEDPSEPALEVLRKACAHRAKDEAAPSLDELSPHLFSVAEAQLERGDIFMARGLTMIIEKRCVQTPAGSAGPVSWLGSTLICHYPEILVEAFAEEHPSNRTIHEIMDYESPERWKKCDPDGIRVGKSFIERKLHLLARIQTQNPLEEEILEDLFQHYKFTDIARHIRVPAEQHVVTPEDHNED